MQLNNSFIFWKILFKKSETYTEKSEIEAEHQNDEVLVGSWSRWTRDLEAFRQPAKSVSMIDNSYKQQTGLSRSHD